MKKVVPTGAKPEAPRSATGRRVLYVEDEDLNWDVAQLQLGASYQLVRAANDVEACNAVRRFGSDLYAILMDIQLMGSTIDGIGLTQLFRGKWDASRPLPPFAQGLPPLAVPILFVTAYSARYSEEELRKVGGDGLVTKPVNFLSLNLALAGASARRSVAALQG